LEGELIKKTINYILTFLLFFLLLSCNFNSIKAETNNPEAIIELNEETIILINKNIIFDGSKSTDNIEIVNWTWIINYNENNITLYDNIINYTFENPGLYNISLVVTDNENNTDTETIQILVKDIYQWWSYILSYIIVFFIFGIIYVIIINLFKNAVYEKRKR